MTGTFAACRRRAGHLQLPLSLPLTPLSPDRTEVAETFDSMGLHENLLRGIYAYGAPPSIRVRCNRDEP